MSLGGVCEKMYNFHFPDWLSTFLTDFPLSWELSTFLRVLVSFCPLPLNVIVVQFWLKFWHKGVQHTLFLQWPPSMHSNGWCRSHLWKRSMWLKLSLTYGWFRRGRWREHQIGNWSAAFNIWWLAPLVCIVSSPLCPLFPLICFAAAQELDSAKQFGKELYIAYCRRNRLPVPIDSESSGSDWSNTINAVLTVLDFQRH